MLPFVIGSTPPTDSNPYLTPYLDGDEKLPSSFIAIGEILEGFPIPGKSKLLYHINGLTNVQCLCIPPSVTPDILAVAHGEDHLRFSCCYEIITYSQFIHGFTKLFHVFIQYCFQCLTLQTRQHSPYGSVQPIKSPFVSFFILTLDFVLALPQSKEKYNAMMSVTCKFTKRVTFIEGANIWLTKQ